MRFMMFIYPGVKEEADWTPSAEAVAAMSKYNEELTRAGVLLSLDGLHPTSEGARISFEGGKRRITDGPFAETKELLGGYYVIDVPDLDTALGHAARMPSVDRGSVEVRPVIDMSKMPGWADRAAAPAGR